MSGAGTADFTREEVLRQYDQQRRPGAQAVEDTAIPHFYRKPIYQKKASEEAGRPIYIERDYVKIINPGIDRDIPDMRVKDIHKDRFPAQWEAYQAGRTDAPVEGSPLELCALVQPAWAATLKAMNCHTVEALVNFPEQAAKKLGPIEFPSGFEGLRSECRKWLNVRGLEDEKDTKISVLESALEAANGEIATLKGKLATAGRKPRPKGKVKKKAAAKPKGEGEGTAVESPDNGPEHRERDGVS